jgi:hypothetical protein
LLVKTLKKSHYGFFDGFMLRFLRRHWG